MIGIIAVLIALLMPALSEARQAAFRTKCLSNLSQLALGFLMYANDNQGDLPYSAVEQNEQPEDFIYWQPDRNLNQSILFTYLSTQNPNVFLCPADDPTYRVLQWGGLYYHYSYSMNMYMSSSASANELNAGTSNANTPRVGTIFAPSDKLLLVCEDAVSIDDGNFNPTLVGDYDENLLAIRHDRPLPPGINDVPYDGDPKYIDNAWRGNVACVDGHAEFVPRAWIRMQFHYDPRIPQ